jgi:hypothetical protein
MRCVTCGTEMHLVEVAQDNTKMVRGYEHHVFVCSGCGEVERRLVFNKTENPATGRNVKIVYDHGPEAVFSANDTMSGMVVMRHQDRQRLQELVNGLVGVWLTALRPARVGMRRSVDGDH